MKVLLDTCVWSGVCNILVDAGIDATWVGVWNEDPGDAEILNRAYLGHRVLITLDKDFSELIVLHPQPHSGIIRLVGLSTREQSEACLKILSAYKSELEKEAIITANRDRIRIRAKT